MTVDRIHQSSLYYTRAGYRCQWTGVDEKGVSGKHRHRFTGISPEQPLTQRHPTHEHPTGEDCPRCDRGYPWNMGLPTGRSFIYAGIEIANLEIGIGQGHPIREKTSDLRRDAYRFRPPTRSHRRPEQEHDDPEIDPEEYAALEAIDELLSQQQNADQMLAMRDSDTLDYFGPEDPWADPDEEPLTLEGLVDLELSEMSADEQDEDEPFPTDPAADPRRNMWVSKSFALGAQYIDKFGPVCSEPSRRRTWPEIIAIDSLPVRRGRGAEESDDRLDDGVRDRADFMFEVMGASGKENGFSELISLWPGGTKDRLTWLQFFATKGGAPMYVVSDLDPAIAKAVELAFPNAIHFRCQTHIAKRIQIAAKADGVSRGSRVWKAIDYAQYSAEHWEQFKSVVEADVPAGRGKLRDWIADNDSLILRQCDIARTYREYPRTAGRLESVLAKVRTAFSTRKFTMRNRERLVKILELIRAEMSGHADLYEYAARITAELASVRKERIDWQSYRDHLGKDQYGQHTVVRNSILEFRSQSRQRMRYVLIAEEQAHSAMTHRSLREKAAEEAAHAGGSPNVRRPRSQPRGPVARAGQKVANVPAYMRYWDNAKNAALGYDPAVMAAQSNTEVYWLCEAHLAGDPNGHWPSHVHRWLQSPARRGSSGAQCPFCQRKRVCPANCVRATHPHLVAEWDYTANGEMTPDNMFYGSQETVQWLCLKGKGHPSYRKEIRTRATSASSCPECQKEASKAKRLATQRARRAEDHRFVNQPRPAPPPDDELF